MKTRVKIIWRKQIERREIKGGRREKIKAEKKYLLRITLERSST